MEGTPTLYTLQPSSRSRIYPRRATLKTHIIVPYNSPASSTISGQFSSVTECYRKQRHDRFAGREASARRQTETVLQTVMRKGSSSSHVSTEIPSKSISNKFDSVTGCDRKQRRVRFSDWEASAGCISKAETVPRTYDSVIQEGSSSSRLTAEMSSTSVPAVHYSKEREIRQVFQPEPAITVVPGTSCRPVVVQIDDNGDLKNNTPNNCSYRIAVECSPKSSTKKAYILGYQFVKKCKICLKPYLLMSAAVRSRGQPEIPTAPNSTPDSNFIYKEIALPRMCDHCPVLSQKWRGFCQATSCITTVGGLASYVYMLLLFFSSNAEFAKQRPLFPLVALVSNVCLTIALFCNCML